MKALHIIIDGALVTKRARTWKELSPKKEWKRGEETEKSDAFILLNEATTPPTLVAHGRAVDFVKAGGRLPETFIWKNKMGAAGIFATDNVPTEARTIRATLLMRFA